MHAFILLLPVELLNLEQAGKRLFYRSFLPIEEKDFLLLLIQDFCSNIFPINVFFFRCVIRRSSRFEKLDRWNCTQALNLSKSHFPQLHVQIFSPAIFYPPILPTHTSAHKEEAMSPYELPSANQSRSLKKYKRIMVSWKSTRAIFSGGNKPLQSSEVKEYCRIFSSSSIYEESEMETDLDSQPPLISKWRNYVWAVFVSRNPNAVPWRSYTKQTGRLDYLGKERKICLLPRRNLPRSNSTNLVLKL